MNRAPTPGLPCGERDTTRASRGAAPTKRQADAMSSHRYLLEAAAVADFEAFRLGRARLLEGQGQIV